MSKEIIKSESLATKLVRYKDSKHNRTHAITMLVTDYIRNEMLSDDFKEMWYGKWGNNSKISHVDYVFTHIKQELIFQLNTDKTKSYEQIFWEHINKHSIHWYEPNKYGKYVLSLIEFFDEMKDVTYFRLVDNVIEKIN